MLFSPFIGSEIFAILLHRETGSPDSIAVIPEPFFRIVKVSEISYFNCSLLDCAVFSTFIFVLETPGRRLFTKGKLT